VILVLRPAPITGARQAELSSHWKDRTITIDGVDDEWTNLTQSIDKPPIAIGIVNDGDSLYLCVKASDQATRMQILRQGLMVWFDPQGGEKKVFGIKYPVPGPMELPPGGARGRYRSAPEGGQQRVPFEEPPNRLEIYGPRKEDQRTLVLEEARGIQVKVGEAEGVLVYELKVALARQVEGSFGIGAAPGATVGVGLETPEMQRPDGGPGRRGAGGGFGGPGGGGFGGPRGGMGGAGGMGGPGEMGGGRPGRGFEMPKPMKVWVTARLASERASGR
jgi:hypothetical protein